MGRGTNSNLRPATTRFIGREQEREQLQSLYDEGHRLVTIFGPAGTGKTRLAEALGREAVARLALGGVWICELAEVRDLDGLCSIIERTLGVPARPSGNASDQVTRLGRAIAARGPLLLILDNFEQLAALAPTSVSVWLQEAPDLRLMVTSREQLRVKGEVRFELSPLSVPGV
ncbi:MAG: AAA family ATPase, partial [Myxococcota bacterium]